MVQTFGGAPIIALLLVECLIGASTSNIALGQEYYYDWGEVAGLYFRYPYGSGAVCSGYESRYVDDYDTNFTMGVTNLHLYKDAYTLMWIADTNGSIYIDPSAELNASLNRSGGVIDRADMRKIDIVGADAKWSAARAPRDKGGYAFSATFACIASNGEKSGIVTFDECRYNDTVGNWKNFERLLELVQITTPRADDKYVFL